MEEVEVWSTFLYWPDGEDAAVGIKPKEKEICGDMGTDTHIWQEQDKSSPPDIIHRDPSLPFAYIVTAYA